MPLNGTLDLASRDIELPKMADLDTEPLVIEKADVLQLLFEVPSAGLEALIPPALHPTLPPTFSAIAWRVRDSELGSFTMAQVRVGARAGVRPRGYLVGATIDDPDAGRLLSERWGYRFVAGVPALRTYHDLVDLTVTGDDGRTILHASLVNPEPMSGSDVQYVANMNPAITPSGPRLVQVDPEFAFHKADRGRPVLHEIDGAAWGEPGLTGVWPVSASCTVADITLPRIRYVCRLEVDAFQGTEQLR